jgi:hypothetical protein
MLPIIESEQLHTILPGIVYLLASSDAREIWLRNYYEKLLFITQS